MLAWRVVAALYGCDVPQRQVSAVALFSLHWMVVSAVRLDLGALWGHVTPSVVCGSHEDSQALPSGAQASFCMDAPQNGFLLKSIDLQKRARRCRRPPLWMQSD